MTALKLQTMWIFDQILVSHLSQLVLELLTDGSSYSIGNDFLAELLLQLLGCFKREADEGRPGILNHRPALI